LKIARRRKEKTRVKELGERITEVVDYNEVPDKIKMKI